MVHAGLLRKAGIFDAAEAVARTALQQSPDWHAASALGLVLREKGDPQGAELAFKTALQLDPEDISARLEAGDTFFERQQWQAALAWYENALARDKKQPWALPSAVFCRWMLTKNESYLSDLVELAKENNSRARELHHYRVAGGLPGPFDATANMLREHGAQIFRSARGEPGGEITVTLNLLEAPSNYLAFRLGREAQGCDVRLKVSVQAVPEPDPREPIEEVKYLLWKYDGTEAFPGLPPPAADVVRRIAELAAAPFDPQTNWAAASRMAEALGVSRVGEILAVMVHPPPVPDGLTALTWLPRVQLAAAQVAAQVDEGWQQSVRREALLSVLWGPRDWTTEAAIRVLAYLACQNEVLAPAIHDAFHKLADHRPGAGYWGWVHVLYQCWQDLPHLFPDEREDLQRTLRDIEATDTKNDE